MKICFVVIMMALSATHLLAAEWYVSIGTGKNQNAGNTPDAPFKNIQKAMDVAETGDTIKVAAGNDFGLMNSGNIIMKKAVTLEGGYAPDFSVRDVLKYQTRIQPDNNSNSTGGNHPLLRIEVKQGDIVIDGIFFNKGDANNYHLSKGVVEGLEDGILLYPPTIAKQGMRPNTAMPMIAGPGSGGLGNSITIRNCAFVNADNYALRFATMPGVQVTIVNNIFVSTVMAAAEIWGIDARTYGAVEFAYNTVLFNWGRTTEMSDMGYGVRAMTQMNYDIHHNIIGFSTLSGLDATRIDAARKLKIDQNVLLFNKQADLTLPGGGSFMRIWVSQFEDLEIESCNDNSAPTDISILAKALNSAYTAGFLSASYKETTDFDENSPANQFRAAMGMNKQGKIESVVSMYANQYPFDDAVKLFGAAPVGAQLPAPAK